MKKHPLKTLIFIRKLSVTTFSELANMPRQVIYRKMKSNKWTMDEVERIATALKVDRNMLIDILQFKKKVTKKADIDSE